MAWISDDKKTFSLKHSPSLGLNNLTSSVSKFAYIHKGDVIIYGLDGELKQTLVNDGGARAMEVLLCSGEDFDFLVVALNTGVQIWSSDGRRLIYFFDSKAAPGSSSVDGGDSFTQTGPHGEACELTATLRGHDQPITCAAADSECCVSGDANPATGLCARDGSVVASYSTGHLRVFDTQRETLSIEIAAHSRTINAMDLHPSSMLLATVGEDLFLNVWELPECGQAGPCGQVGLVASSHVTNRLLTGVRFLADGSHRIIGLAYDYDHLQMWHKLD